MGITKERIDKLLDYNPDTGVFTWRYRHAVDYPNSHARGSWNSQHAGKEAGGIELSSGNRRIMIDGKNAYARRLAFITMTGKPPGSRVKHRDGDNGNLAWANLTTTAQLKQEAAACIPPPPRAQPRRNQSNDLLNTFLAAG